MVVARVGRRSLVTALAVASGAVGAAATAGPASAAGLLSSCTSTAALSQPFAPWGDTNEYRAMPGGSFSDGAPGWTLSGGAGIVATDDPYNLAGGDSPASVSLPAGGSAQSPFTCVDASQPTVRFVDAGAASTTLRVEVIYQLITGGTASGVAALLSPGQTWSPSPIIQDGAQVAGLLSGGTAEMAVRITALGGPAQLDDVFVDPRMHGI